MDLADPKAKSKIIKLGALRVGQTLRKQVPIINNSLRPVSFNIGFTPSNVTLLEHAAIYVLPNDEITLPARGGKANVDIIFSPKTRISQFTEEVCASHSLSFSVHLFSSDDFCILCLSCSCFLLVTWSVFYTCFLVTERSFYALQVLLETTGISQPLFAISGSCHALDVKLDSNYMPFGEVVQNSLRKRKVLLANKGDIGTK